MIQFKVYDIFFSNHFNKELKKIIKKNPALKTKVTKQIELLIENPSHKSLRVHKLSGTANFSLSVTMNIRVIFSIRRGMILCTKIGSHDQVYLKISD